MKRVFANISCEDQENRSPFPEGSPFAYWQKKEKRFDFLFRPTKGFDINGRLIDRCTLIMVQVFTS